MRNLLCFALLFATSCGSSTTTYVGSVENTDIAVGIVSDGTHTALFFCGSLGNQSTTTKWLRFTQSSSSFTATANAWSATGTMSGSTVMGTVDKGGGQTLSWSATRVGDADVAGLYESVSADGTAGVVVKDASHAQGAFITAQQQIEQIIPIMPLQLTDHGLHVTIGTADAFVPRALAE